MAKFVILFFLSAGSAGVSYLTYTGIGQETIKTVSEDKTARSNSSHRGGSWGGSSYNSSSYGYGK